MEHITYNIFLLAILVTPGIMAHHFLSMLQCPRAGQSIKFNTISEVTVFSVLVYGVRSLLGTLIGYGNAHPFVYFDTSGNILNYIVLSMCSVVLLVYCYIFLHKNVLPLWLETRKEGTLNEKQEAQNESK